MQQINSILSLGVFALLLSACPGGADEALFAAERIELKRQIESLKKSSERVERELLAKRRECDDLLARSGTPSELAQCKSQSRDIEDRLAQANAKVQELAKKNEDLNREAQAERARLQGQVDALKEEKKKAAESLALKQSEQEALQRQIALLEQAKLDAQRVLRLKEQSCAQAGGQQLAQCQSRIEQLEEKARLASDELQQATAKQRELQTKLDEEKEHLRQARESLEAANRKIDELQRAGGQPVAKRPLRNPTWDELKQFLTDDNTNERTYVLNVFDCKGFAIKCRDNARDLEIRSAFISISFNESVGHALNAFETSDRGLIYVDVGGSDKVGETGLDKIGYIEKGKPYAMLSIDVVKDTLIDCSGSPGNFWQPIQMVQYPDSLFEYAYYEHQVARRRFHADSLAAYEVEDQEHDRERASLKLEIEEYNARKSALSHEQILEWQTRVNENRDRLNGWVKNLNQLMAEFGPIYGETRAVENVMTLWND